MIRNEYIQETFQVVHWTGLVEALDTSVKKRKVMGCL